MLFIDIRNYSQNYRPLFKNNRYQLLIIIIHILTIIFMIPLKIKKVTNTNIRKAGRLFNMKAEWQPVV